MTHAVLFDLDGTLLDTAPDLGYALNRVLIAEGRLPLPMEVTRPVSSHGTQGLLQLGFGEHYAPRLAESFLSIYHDHIADNTVFFPGMELVLSYLAQAAIPWGIVTNKPAYLTERLLEKFSLTHRAHCIVSGDTLAERKPHPAPLHHACRLMNHIPANCLYIGDAERDIEAGRRAGMKTVIAGYGYIAPADKPETWGATHFIQKPEEILQTLGHDLVDIFR